MLEYYSTENSREQRISPLENQKKSPIFLSTVPAVDLLPEDIPDKGTVSDFFPGSKLPFHNEDKQ